MINLNHLLKKEKPKRKKGVLRGSIESCVRYEPAVVHSLPDVASETST